MPTDTKLKELIINELTEEQYKALTPNDDELYLTPDGSITKNENGSYVFNDGLEVKSNGDVTVGKNLEVDGTAKLNSGFKPIHIYKMYDSPDEVEYTIEVWFEVAYDKNNENSNEYNFFGKYYASDGTGPSYMVYGDYLLTGEGDNIEYLTAFIVYGYYRGGIGAIHYDGVVTKSMMNDSIPLSYKTQGILYRHTLTLTASDKTYILVYDSTSNLNADSVADLRTIMKISSTHESEVLPLCPSDMTSTACLKVTASVCQIGTNNVTTVTDVVNLK